jgi:hypothetical protein
MMERKFPKQKGTLWTFCFFLLCSLIFLAACAPSAPVPPTPNLTLTAVFQQALLAATLAVPTATQTPQPTPTATPLPSATPTPIRTPPALPTRFVTSLLNPLDKPHTYVSGVCEYLKDRWNPENSPPGTVVMPIMFHSITDGEVNHPYQVTASQVDQLLRDLKEQSFEAITMQQLADFLQHNRKIPMRSVLLIVDDLHAQGYYRDHFFPLLNEYHWTVTNAWISEPEASKRVQAENVQLQNEGWVDHQAHGVVHNVNITEFKPGTIISTDLYGPITAEQFTRNELEGSMKAITTTFGRAPIAYVWPGGNFSKLGAQIAREVGFQLGFTINPRGPVMYNWIPLSDETDPQRPAFLAEGYINDPLMVLPRYWDKDAALHLDTVRQIGKQAAEEAVTNRAVELEYYDIVCKPRVGEIPGLIP